MDLQPRNASETPDTVMCPLAVQSTKKRRRPLPGVVAHRSNFPLLLASGAAVKRGTVSMLQLLPMAVRSVRLMSKPSPVSLPWTT